jgi:hypothetical protein
MIYVECEDATKEEFVREELGQALEDLRDAGELRGDWTIVVRAANCPTCGMPLPVGRGERRHSCRVRDDGNAGKNAGKRASRRRP